MNKLAISLSGVFPPIPTPFDAQGDVAIQRLVENIERWNQYDLSGYVVLGSNGEAGYLSEEEKLCVLAAARQAIPSDKLVIAGAGCESTRQTIALSRRAADAGADGVLLVTPHYYDGIMTPDSLIHHYRAVADDVPIPVLLYTVPKFTHVDMDAATVARAASHPNIVGIKDTSGDMPFLMALFEKIKGQIGIFCGHDEIVMAALAAGADGAILASANLIPDIWQKIYAAVKSGDLATAQDWQARVQKLVRIIIRKGATQAVKEGLRMMGLDMGNSRHPIMPGGAFEREDREELRIQLENLGKIEVSSFEFRVSSVEDFTLRVG